MKQSCDPGYIAPVSYSSLSSTRFSWGKEANATGRPQLPQPPQPSLAVTLLCFMATKRQTQPSSERPVCLSRTSPTRLCKSPCMQRLLATASSTLLHLDYYIIFGRSASPALQGTGRGMKYETHFFKLGEVTIENYPFFCLPLSPLLSLRSSWISPWMLLSQRAKRSVFPLKKLLLALSPAPRRTARIAT